MSTRSLIGILYEDITDASKPENEVKYIYCHFDGHPSCVGKELKSKYSTEAKLERLLNLGSCSSISPEVVTYHSRGEDWEDVQPKTITLEEYREKDGIDYVYLFDPHRKIWHCWRYNKTKVW